MNDTPPSKFLSPDVAATRHHLVRIVAAVPILVFLGIAALLAVRLGVDNPSLVPSALIGRPVPQFALSPLEGFATHRAARPVDCRPEGRTCDACERVRVLVRRMS